MRRRGEGEGGRIERDAPTHLISLFSTNCRQQQSHCYNFCMVQWREEGITTVDVLN